MIKKGKEIEERDEKRQKGMQNEENKKQNVMKRQRIKGEIDETREWRNIELERKK